LEHLIAGHDVSGLCSQALSTAVTERENSIWQVLLGDMGAGKSSLVLRFVKGQFFDYQVLASSVSFIPHVPHLLWSRHAF
jgi:GTPase SAR1 family protein